MRFGTCREHTHRTTRAIHYIIDFFARVFTRGDFDDPTRLRPGFSFEAWARTPAAQVDIEQFPERGSEDVLSDDSGLAIHTPEDWRVRNVEILDRLR
ncbi:hypothetical protein, partial [Staphylococcus aureus]|uniref:hypothetical protein n=1 Tax=Staphylococcus aureus TaxID=1280 RepID=UPI001A924348